MWHPQNTAVLAIQFQPFYPSPEIYWAEQLPRFLAQTGFLTFSLFYDILGIELLIVGFRRGAASKQLGLVRYAPALTVLAIIFQLWMLLRYAVPSAEMLHHWVLALAVWCAACFLCGGSVGLWRARARNRKKNFESADSSFSRPYFEEEHRPRSVWLLVFAIFAWIGPLFASAALAAWDYPVLSFDTVIAFELLAIIPWIWIYRWARRVVVRVDSKGLVVKLHFTGLDLPCDEIASYQKAFFNKKAGRSVAYGVVRLSAKSMQASGEADAVEVTHRNGNPMLIRTKYPAGMVSALEAATHQSEGQRQLR